MWIVGMMGSGKTTAGRLAAQELGVRFSDTDEIVVERMGCSIAQFWGERGEAAFRKVEKVAMAGVASRDGVKVTGGGAVLDESNRAVLSKSARVVWLRAAPETLVKRMGDRQERPLVAGNESPHVEVIAEILRQRTDFYDEVATDRVDTDGLDVVGVADALGGIWRS